MHIDCIDNGSDFFIEWVVDKENNETLEHTIRMPFVGYSEMVHNFMDDVYTIEESNKDMELTRYGDILKVMALNWVQNL